MRTDIRVRHFWKQVVIFPSMLLPAIALIIYHQTTFWNYTCDDSYISFRYAENLVRGHGLVFNAGERVEGFSNFLWTVILAASTTLHGDIVLNSKILGILSLLGLLVYAGLICRQLANNHNICILGTTSIIAMNTSINYYATSGLETIFMGFVLTAGTFYFISRHESRIRFFVAVMLFVCVAITRPEGVIFLFFVCGFRILEAIFLRDTLTRTEIMAMITGGLMFVAFLLFRYVYYDELLPNTFFAKPDDWIGSTTFPEGGLNYTNIFHQRNGGYFLIPLIVLLLGMKAHFGKVLFILGVISGGIVFVFYANVDWMQNERFYIPYMGLFYAGALAAIIYLVSSSLRRMWPGILFLLTLFIFSGLDQIQRARTIGKHEASYPYHLMSCIYLDRVGKDLFQKYRGKGVLATKRAGAIPYYSKLKTIDAYGLNDREIAKAFHENEPTKRRRLAVDIAFKKGPTMTLSFTTRRLSAPKAATIADAKNFSGLDRYLFEKAIKNGFKFEKEYRTGKVEWGYIFKKPDGSISGT